MATEVSTRLDPDVFRLPVERIRAGLLLGRLLRLHQAAARGRGPPPARDDAGVPEAATRCSAGSTRRSRSSSCARARPTDERRGSRAGTSSTVQRAARGRRDRAARDGDDDRGRLQPVRAPRDGLPRRAGAALADHAQRAPRSSRRPAASRSSTSPPATTTGSCRPATAGAPTSPARSASRPTPRPRGGAAAGSGTVPHGLIAAYGGDTVKAAHACSPTAITSEMNITVLVDFENDSVTHRARGGRRRSDRSCGACGSTPPSTSSTARCRTRWAASGPPASTRGWSRRSAARSTARASATSGSSPAAASPRRGSASSRRPASPVDAYGVGSSLIRGENDFTADVVMVDGRPCAKVGRAYSPNPRLERVE